MKIKIYSCSYRFVFICFLNFICFQYVALGQKKTISLVQAIDRVLDNSLEHKIAVNAAQSGYFDYNKFKISSLPIVSLEGVIPSYNRTISKLTTSAGNDIFVAQNQSYSNFTLNATQNLLLTGGILALSTSLNRIDAFGTNDNHRVMYSGAPLSISYFQPSFFFNPIKWQRKIAPIVYEESKRTYSEAIEQISLNTIERYFKLLEAQVQLSILELNLKNADTLYKITDIKFSIGSRDKNDLLQSRLNYLNAKNDLSKGKLHFDAAKKEAYQYLILSSYDDELSIPSNLKFFPIDLKVALFEASNNRQKVLEFRRRRLESERNLADIKSQAGPSISINANLGLSQTSGQLLGVYKDLQRQQSVYLQFNLPLVDWGGNKLRVRKAKSDLEITTNSIEQEHLSFEQEITDHVQQWNILETQLLISEESQAVSLERYNVAKQRYLLGTINFTELNNAQQEKDLAIQSYIGILKLFWISYYTIRKLTLYDFISNKRLIRLESKVDS